MYFKEIVSRVWPRFGAPGNNGKIRVRGKGVTKGYSGVIFPPEQTSTQPGSESPSQSLVEPFLNHNNSQFQTTILIGSITEGMFFLGRLSILCPFLSLSLSLSFILLLSFHPPLPRPSLRASGYRSLVKVFSTEKTIYKKSGEERSCPPGCLVWCGVKWLGVEWRRVLWSAAVWDDAKG